MVITGAAGFIGSAVARAAQARGAKIVALVEPGAGDRNLEGIDADRVMIFNDERARAEIGYASRPAREAIRESARWFADNGYVTARRRAAIKWRE